MVTRILMIMALIGFLGCMDNFVPKDYSTSTKLIGIWVVEMEPYYLYTRRSQVKYIQFCPDDTVFNFAGETIEGDDYVSFFYDPVSLNESQKTIIRVNYGDVDTQLVPPRMRFLDDKELVVEYVNRDLDKSPHVGEARIIIGDTLIIKMTLANHAKVPSLCSE